MLNLRTILSAYSSVHLPGRCPPIFIFSNARSGSTWLAEMIATQSGIRLVDEPLHPNRHKGSNSLVPPTWDFLLPNPSRERILKQYFEQILSGKFRDGGPRFMSRNYRFLTWQVVFKVLRCHDLMDWFESTFNSKIIYLVRHPIATNVSRTEVPRLPLFVSNREFTDKYLSAEQCRTAKRVLDTGTPLQQKVLDWILQNLPPIRFLDRKNWICLHYEDLVIDSSVCVSRIASRLGFAAPHKMLARSETASNSVRISDSATKERFRDGTADKSFLLGKWRSQITERDEEMAFDLLDQFEIDCYRRREDLPVNRL